jgi:hypothetical protein
VLITALKPADAGTGLIVRLFNGSKQAQDVKLSWNERRPRKVFLTDTSEKPAAEFTGSVRLPSCGLATLLLDFGPAL